MRKNIGVCCPLPRGEDNFFVDFLITVNQQVKLLHATSAVLAGFSIDAAMGKTPKVSSLQKRSSLNQWLMIW